jgi:uncharacterized membrane protein YjgN (DUF898 family)
MTTLTVVLINVHAHLIFFCQFQFLTNQRKFEQDRFQKFQKKKNLLYLHCRTHFTKVILAKIL